MKNSDQVAFCQKFGVREVSNLGTYLGLPSCVGRNKSVIFNSLKDRIWAKLNSWSSQLLSKAGKEVLIKYVAQAIPKYYMPCFKMPLQLIHDLNSMINKFWWGKIGGSRGVHWGNWMDLCTSKMQGGKAFRDFECFNDALLGK